MRARLFHLREGCISPPTRPSSITPLDRLPQYRAARERTLCVHHVALPERGEKAAAVGDARTVEIACGEGRGIYDDSKHGEQRIVDHVDRAPQRHLGAIDFQLQVHREHTGARACADDERPAAYFDM